MLARDAGRSPDRTCEETDLPRAPLDFPFPSLPFQPRAVCLLLGRGIAAFDLVCLLACGRQNELGCRRAGVCRQLVEASLVFGRYEQVEAFCFHGWKNKRMCMCRSSAIARNFRAISRSAAAPRTG